MPTSSLVSTKMVWYKRPWVLITFAIVVVVGVSVITDLPHPISKVEDAASQNASMKEINTDIAPCTYAVKESFRFYEWDVTGKLTAANKQQVPSLLLNDQTACSFASGAIYDLTNNVQVLDTTAGKNIDKTLRVIMTWTTGDALAAIEDIQYLYNHPGDAKKIHDLHVQQILLEKDRQIAFGYTAEASSLLGLPITEPQLPSLPHLTGT